MQYQICVLVVAMIETELTRARQFPNNGRYLRDLVIAKEAIKVLMKYF
jgi:hypothetical protein